MSPTLHLELPYPPSANRYWRNVQGRVLISEDARAYKAKVRRLFGDLVPMAGPVSLRLRVHRPARRGDLDNSIKVLLDALTGLVYLDDAQVAAIHATRHEGSGDGWVAVEATGYRQCTPGEVAAAAQKRRETTAKAKATRSANRASKGLGGKLTAHFTAAPGAPWPRQGWVVKR